MKRFTSRLSLAVAAAALAVLASSIGVSAQAVQTSTFEVASVRPVPGGARAPFPCGGAFELMPGRITITGATAYRLVAAAYGLACPAAINVGLITGGPDWLRKDTFDVQATYPTGTPVYSFQQLQNDEAPALQAMLRTLLATRFHLALHRAAKDTPVYNVYFVKEGRIRRSADQTKPSQALTPMASPLQVLNDPAAGTVRIRAEAVPIRTLINVGQGREGRVVVDKTGLSGLYDVEPSVIDVGVVPPGGSTWPQIMSYLGFKLESARAPIETIVIDRIERPTAN